MKLSLRDYNHEIDFTDNEYKTRELVLMKCHECCAFEAVEAFNCNITTCPLWPLNKKWYKIPRNRRLSDTSKEKYKNIMLDVRKRSSKQ